MESTVQFNIEKLEHLQSEIAKAAKSFVKVGVASGKNTRNRVYPPDSETILKTNSQIAREHEFGNPFATGPNGSSINIPERSILRMPMKMELKNEMSKTKTSTYETEFMFYGLEGILDEIGQTAIGLVETNFEKEGYPQGWVPISPKTLFHRKKHGRTGQRLLDDSGQLRSSFDYEVIT
jgi:hypothetical protein